MKYKLFITILMVCPVCQLNAQWTGTNPISTNSNVGVGIAVPSGAKFHSKTTATSETGVFGEALGTSGYCIGVDAESTGLNPYGYNYGIYVASGNAGTNYGVYIEQNWPPAGDNNWALYSRSQAKSYFRGNVGIGTTNPAVKLHIENGENTDAAVLATSSENNKLVVSSGSTQPVYCSTFKITQQFNDNRNNGFISFNRGVNASGGFLTFGTNGLERVRFEANGNILIGKTTQSNSTYKLDVLGMIRADEVVVNTTGADFVFSPEYRLPNLSEVEKYIKENNHLPDIVPAAEMKENGMNVSEMQTKLLQKIEELTLYSIEQEKKNARLEQEMKELKEFVVKKLK